MIKPNQIRKWNNNYHDSRFFIVVGDMDNGIFGYPETIVKYLDNGDVKGHSSKFVLISSKEVDECQ